LERILLGILNLSRILHRLVLQILTKLELELVFRVVSFVKILQPFVKDIRAVIELDGLFVEFSLRVGGGSEAVFRDVVTEAVRSLGILPRGLKMRISHLISCLLQSAVCAFF
jgi:hypothetical protein